MAQILGLVFVWFCLGETQAEIGNCGLQNDGAFDKFFIGTELYPFKYALFEPRGLT